MRKLKNYFISGILFITPVAISVWVLWQLFFFFEGLIGNAIKRFIPQFYIVGFGIIALIILILFLGFLTHNFLGKKLLSWIDSFFLSVPVFKNIYLFIRSLLKQVFSDKKEFFQEVVLVKLAEEVYTLGFITRKEPLLAELGEEYWSVFVPTVPNPTTGILLSLNSKNIKKLPMTVEEGMKIAVSMGIFKSFNAAVKDKGNSPQKG